MAFAKNCDAVTGVRKEVSDGPCHLGACFLHERFRRNTAEDGAPFNLLNLLWREDHWRSRYFVRFMSEVRHL